MKLKFIACAVFFALASMAAAAQEQVLHYKVIYTLGFVHKTAAHACMHQQWRGDSYTATIDGHSISWAGRIFSVSDTLRSTMRPAPQPSGLAQHITYSNGWYSKPTTRQWLDGNFCRSCPEEYRNTRGEGLLDASSETMEAVRITTDMLALFNTLRHIDFGCLTPQQCFTIVNTVAGGGTQRVNITYLGPSEMEIDDTDFRTYDLEFEYYYDGRPSGYRVTCRISRGTRIPLSLSAQLPIGHIRMVYEI